MKKIIAIVFVCLVLLVSVSFVAAAGRKTGQAGMMSQGKIRTCLSPKLAGKPPPAWFKRATVTVQLTGTCEAESCKIIRCNSNNKEIEENENYEKKCKGNHPPAGCTPEKLENNKKKNEKSVEVKPGCKTIGFTTGSTVKAAGQLELNSVLAAANEVPNGTVNITTNEPDYTAHVEYSYYAEGDNPPKTEKTETEYASGSNKSQQLGQIGFTFESAAINGKSKDCTKISWDPYGRVFDAVSLEPLSDLVVTLIDNVTKKPVIQEFEANQTTTGQDGNYNILVEKTGFYQMDVEAPSTHTFSQNPTLNEYYGDIYSDIYLPGSIFEEKLGIATHHDIPLQPIGEPYTGAIAEILTADESIDMGDFMLFTGRSSFPRSQVCMVTETGRTIVGDCVFADEFGEYKIILSKDIIPLEPLVPQAAKVKLTEALWKNSVEQPVASSDIRVYEPILNHIEGFVYDAKGSAIPQADVQVHLKMDDSVYFETKADKDGFVAIYLSELPAHEYYLTYSAPDGKVGIRKTTSSFVKDNMQYIKDNKLNLILAQVDNKPIEPETISSRGASIQTRKSASKQSGSLQTQSQKSISTQTNQNQSNTIGLIVGIGLLLLVGIGAIVVILKSKQQTPQF